MNQEFTQKSYILNKSKYTKYYTSTTIIVLTQGPKVIKIKNKTQLNNVIIKIVRLNTWYKAQNWISICYTHFIDNDTLYCTMSCINN